MAVLAEYLNFFSSWSSKLDIPNFNIDEYIKEPEFEFVDSDPGDDNNYYQSFDFDAFKVNKIEIETKPETIYDLLRSKHNSFYNNLCINYSTFYKMDNNVDAVIRDIKGLFFRNNLFVDDNLKKNIDTLLDSYIVLMKDMFHNEQLDEHIRTNDDFIKIMNKYCMFTPSCIAVNIDIDIDNIMEIKLNTIKDILREFKEKYTIIFNHFTTNTMNMVDDYDNFKDLSIKTITLTIEYAKYLLDLDVYPIHKLLIDMIKTFINPHVFNHDHGKITYVI
jgi:hypothetical protein